MKLPKLTAVIEREDDWFVAACPELGVASQGASIEEAKRMLKEAVDLFLEEADEQEIRRRLDRGVKVTLRSAMSGGRERASLTAERRAAR